MDRLVVAGARQHNLRGVSISLPRGKLVVFTGPSGSGKSSLAFDTIYAEGQRRYVESLSAYARQFLEQLSKPNVERIDGLSPAIAIEQRPLSKSPRSTVGTVTEIADYLRLLFARVGIPHCPNCGKRIEAQTVQQIVDRILELAEGTRFSVLAPIARARKGELKLELERLRREGFVRARVDGAVVDLGDPLELDRSKPHDLDVVVDRVVIKEGVKGRLTDSVELALKIGEGRLLVAVEGEEPFWLSERFACIDCGISLPPIEPRMFSFNGPHGACPACDGLGARTVVDPERVIGDPTRTLREGVLLAWGRRGSVALATELARAVEALGVNPDTPWGKLAEATRKTLLFGDGKVAGEIAAESETTGDARPSKSRGRASSKKSKGYAGIVPRLQARLEADEPAVVEDNDDPDEDEGAIGDDELGRFLVTRTCTACKGRRLRPEALAIQLGGRDIAELGRMPLEKLRKILSDLGAEDAVQAFSTRERAVAEPLLRAVTARLGFLIDVGLDYLSLDRSAQTLSSGEGQRIRLATQIGAALVGVLYVLDEPSVGLHARDNARLIEAQARLRDLGNTVFVVEHDREAILAADHVVDMGPGAGVHGGQVVAQGTPKELMANPASITGPWLSGKKQLPIPKTRKAKGKAQVRVVGARAHNLKNVTASVPIGLFTCFTGVSGSGKSSLVVDTLLPAARAKLYSATAPIGECDAVEGLDNVDKVISIDQAPIGRTPRSNPATYTGVFALLRELYAGLPEARARGYKAGRFSFNVKGGRCEACQGDGVLRVEMHFLPDIFVTCDTCGGKRYNRETLEVKYRGLSIADALEVTVEQALELFDTIPRVRDRLDALRRVGLGYLTLGQPATTLSGGEAQRVKLARELARKATGRTLYVLDEPTTGLHFTDIEVLLGALLELRDQGNTVVVIEHNLDVVACADWVIDLGPEGGDKGGEIVAEGTPEQVVKVERSHTGKYLRDVLGRAEGKPSSGKKKGAAA
ncbi:Excinuclease ABC subunit A [Labilithrix luteola]|uniref:UvrABC system protein A n=1 Tax=Labilithrix luteola TaxID=1391654 RepID=A0A0K1Q0Y6_9BACT|nr:excinuclease ABC subunit UvrA [Labilithrix luteola]AKU99445.1 Excinuclease ABC subunit A [Labilithrix luteola]